MADGIKIITGCILLVFVLLFLGGVIMHSQFSDHNMNINRQWAKVQPEFEKKISLMAGIIGTFKKYEQKERSIFIEIDELSNMWADAKDINTKVNTANIIDAESVILLEEAQNYPGLLEDAIFIEQEKQLSDIDTSINNEREKYNKAVKQYNELVNKFPNSIVAWMFDFKERDYFVPEEAAKDEPKVIYE